MPGSKITTGFVDFTPTGLDRPCQTWYQIHGDLTLTGTPLIIPHGGPGATHNYPLPIADLVSQYNIPVIFYDQLGCGNSTHLHKKSEDDSLWTFKLFGDELDNLVISLKLARYDLLGHSFGGKVATEHAIPPSRGKRTCQRRRGCSLSRLPDDVQDALNRHEAAGTFDDPEYRAAVGELMKRFSCSVPFPLMDESMGLFLKTGYIHRIMKGPSQFNDLGTMKGWSVEKELHWVNVPTLLLNGKDDVAADFVMQPFEDHIRDTVWVRFENSSHNSYWEEREKWMKTVGEFLKD